MNKKSIFIFFITLIVIFNILKVLNVFCTFSIPTPAMVPNYPVGSHVYGSNLKSHTYNSVVFFNSEMIGVPGIVESQKGVFIGRIVAKGGDTLELINGYSYVNGSQVDKGIDLQFRYKITKDVLDKNQDFFENIDTYEKNLLTRDQVAYITDSEKEKLIGVDSLIKDEKFFSNPEFVPMMKFLKEKNSSINYGPIVIPHDSLFIIGDNRQNSQDSRHKGFVHENDLVATSLN